MKKRLFVMVLAAVCVCWAFPPAAVSENRIARFSADMVMTASDGTPIGKSRLYITPEAYRMDGMPMGAGQLGMPKEMTIIGRNDLNRQYMYNHDKKLVFESDMDEQEVMELIGSYENIDSEEILGKETVSGYPCVKKRVVVTTETMGTPITRTEIIWQSDRFDMPLKIRNEEGHISHLRNIVTKTPSSELFRPITGYKKVNNIMAVMGMDLFGGEMPESESGETGYAADRKDSAGDTGHPDIRDMDPDGIMEAIEKLTAIAGGDQEQLAQLREALTHALELSRQTDMDPGAADGLWQIVPRRPGDLSDLLLSQADRDRSGTCFFSGCIRCGNRRRGRPRGDGRQEGPDRPGRRAVVFKQRL